MWARFTVLNETPIASAIAGCVIPLSRSNTIWMRSRCAAGIFHRSAVFSSRICFLVHLTIRPPESDSQSESYPAPSRDPKKRQKSLDSNSYGSGIRACKGAKASGSGNLPAGNSGPALLRGGELGFDPQHRSDAHPGGFRRRLGAHSLEQCLPDERLDRRIDLRSTERVTGLGALLAGPRQAGHHPLADQGALELREPPEHLEHGAPGWRRRVEPLLV